MLFFSGVFRRTVHNANINKHELKNYLSYFAVHFALAPHIILLFAILASELNRWRPASGKILL